MPLDSLPSRQPEPLARRTDIDEFRAALAGYRAGEWSDEKFTAFRLRFGVYGQRQDGYQMVRIKVPGGLFPVDWARKVADVTRRHAKGDVHITTRQDVQIYYVRLDDAPALLADLYEVGLTTREACGNTLRNMSACALSGICPREHVDAGKVADQLARAWIRHPLVQHMPRKFKTTVSGCATDCGAAGIHDLGLIATEENGEKGFKVYAGGGTGGQPRSAVLVHNFVTEDELPAVTEALVRLHQRYSSRRNRNAARIKFLVKRFGEAKFRDLFLEEFERARALPQRAWEPLEWRQAVDAPEPTSPGGLIWQHDGRMGVVVSLPLGLLTPDQLDALANLAERYAFGGLRTTRDQNLVIVGIEPEVVQEVVDRVRALDLAVERHVGDVPDVVSCPGTTSCRLGITNSQNFGREVQELVRDYAPKPHVTVRMSGCHNGCGLHHVGDFGFRGMAKKIDGRNAPHYQLYIGGDPRAIDGIGLAGPIVPALYAKQALQLLLKGYEDGREGSESVRDWALRLGKPGLKALLAPLAGRETEDGERLFVDWGEADAFLPPEIVHGECAAPFAMDSLYRDLADDGLIDLDRALDAGNRAEALASGRRGAAQAGRRLLQRAGVGFAEEEGPDDIDAKLRTAYAGDDEVPAALDALRETEVAAAAGGDIDAYREALALYIDTVEDIVQRPVERQQVNAAAFGDFDAGVLDLIRGQAAAE